MLPLTRTNQHLRALMVYRHHREARISPGKATPILSRPGICFISFNEVGVFILLLPHLVSMASIPDSNLPI